MRIGANVATGACMIMVAASAQANTEPPGLYDTRSLSMGGTGVAHVDSGMAPYHNVAGLAGVERFSGTLTFSPYLTQLKTPWPDPTSPGDTEELSSTRSLAPLTALGFGLRLHERVVVGLTAYLTCGSGARYEKVAALGGADAEMAALAGELQVPVAVELVKEKLAVGVAYRLTYANISASVPMLADPTDPTLGFVNPEIQMDGFNPFSAAVGVWARPIDMLRLGLSYRSRAVVDVSGDTKIGGTKLPGETKGEFAIPHKIVLGAAVDLLDEKLVLAVDLKYWLYSDSNQANSRNRQADDWQDSVLGGVGGEYWLSELVPLRVGFNAGRSATTPETATPFSPPPGWAYLATLGSGIHLEPVDVDLGGGYYWGSDKVGRRDADPLAGRMQGDYSMDSIVLSLSATVHL